RYHLKLTDEQDRLPRMRRWQDLHEILEQRYRAPRLIEWMDFAGIGFSGLLFEHIDGATVDLNRRPDLAEQIVALAASLHNDSTIRESLQVGDRKKTYFDHFVDTYIDRFMADLSIVASERPLFVGADLLDWMSEETRRMQERAHSMASFRAPAVEPVHG